MTSVVSVIIPIYNAQDFLEKAVKSALAHSCVGEVILIDDGSSDKSYELCLKLSKQLDKIVLLTHPNRTNLGAAVTRNLGIKCASFPLVAFLDSDDTYYSNRFSEAITVLENNPSIQACFGRVEVRYVDSEFSKMMGFLKKDKSTSVLNYLLKGGYFHTNSITVRREFFDEVGYFDQGCWPHEDSELWIRMAAQGRLEAISDTNPIASYLIHGNNLSKVASLNSRNKMWYSVYRKVFYLPIGISNRVLILNKLMQSWLKRYVVK